MARKLTNLEFVMRRNEEKKREREEEEYKRFCEEQDELERQKEEAQANIERLANKLVEQERAEKERAIKAELEARTKALEREVLEKHGINPDIDEWDNEDTREWVRGFFGG